MDCCYCKHFGGHRGYPDGYGETALCQFHGVTLPQPEPSYLNRVCCHFEPDDTYWKHNRFWMPPARRFAWFARDLMPGVLYMFGYNSPDKIEREVVLRVADYHADCWKNPEPRA
jgi:hypothetical protein